MKKIILLLASVSLFASCVGGNAKIESVKDSTAYSVGVFIGNQLKQIGDDLDPKIVMEAVNDVYGKKEDKIRDAYVYIQASQIAEQAFQVDSTFNTNAIVTGFIDVMKEKEFIKAENAGQYIMDYVVNKSKAEAEAFMAEADKVEGIQKTENGIRYIIEQQGEGAISDSDKVSVNYTLFNYKGDTIDSSITHGEPLEVQLPSGVVPGFAQAIQLVGVGGKLKVWIPGELGYGEAGSRGGVGPNQVLKFDIEVLEKLATEN